ncbi:MAG: HEAT repeat domain-containing protein [Promethearchaeota archaeon]
MDSNSTNSRDNEYNLAVKNLFHGKIMERASAARQIGHFKDGRATNILVRALNSEEDSIVINRIIEAMGDVNDAKATMIIVDVLKRELEKQESEQDKSLLFLIVESLMKIGDKRALEHLIGRKTSKVIVKSNNKNLKLIIIKLQSE